MSQFYASIEGNRGPATRQGSKASGIHGHIRGWHVGAGVSCFVDGGGETAKDSVVVSKTAGSSGFGTQTGTIATFTADELTGGILYELLDAAKRYTMHMAEMDGGKWLNSDPAQELVKAINSVDDIFNRGS